MTSRLLRRAAVGAVAVLALAAVADSVVDHEAGRPSARRANTSGDEMPASGIAPPPGVLYAADVGCHVVEVDLTAGTFVDIGEGCRFSDQRLDPTAALSAGCAAGHVLVRNHAGRVLASARGCSPAWKPDGTLTYADRGEILRLPRKVVMRRGTLARLLGISRRRAHLVVDTLAWLDDRTMGAAVTSGKLSVGAVFSGDRLVSRVSLQAPATTIVASPTGAFVAFVTRTETVVVSLSEKSLPRRLPGVRAIAWAPDESAYAIAGRNALVVVPLRPNRSMLAVPFDAASLSWRA